MQSNKIMYIDLVDPLPKSYAPKKGEEINRSTYSTMRYRVLYFFNSEILLILQIYANTMNNITLNGCQVPLLIFTTWSRKIAMGQR